MQRIARFEKVSKMRFVNDIKDCFSGMTDEAASGIYNELKLPIRATSGSAGYDFFMPCDRVIAPGRTVKIPTGMRVSIKEGWVLKLYPRSGLGFKFRLQLNNTVGIIDSDYYYSDNEGHIFIKITNDTNENRTISLNAGEGFAQGIFVEYGITIDDDVQTKRNGGLGSTTSEGQE